MNWMGKYKPLIETLVRFGHLSSQISREPIVINEEITLNSIEWQLFEYVYEHGEDTKMANVYTRLGIPQSTFSKSITVLCSFGLVDKKTTDSNRKNKIITITPKGKELYEKHAKNMKPVLWDSFFKELEPLSEDDLQTVTRAIGIICDDMSK